MTLRKATLQDMDGLIDMAEAMLLDSDYNPFDVSKQRFTQFATPLITHGFAMVKEVNDRLVGAVLGDVITPWFSTKRMGIEYAVYIRPEHRNGLTAARMITKWCEWCKANQAVQCRAGISTGNMAVATLYERLGFRRSGTNFILDF
jgi:L-amino acid N-acyltransferase YncA